MCVYKIFNNIIFVKLSSITLACLLAAIVAFNSPASVNYECTYKINVSLCNQAMPY